MADTNKTEKDNYLDDDSDQEIVSNQKDTEYYLFKKEQILEYDSDTDISKVDDDDDIDCDELCGYDSDDEETMKELKKKYAEIIHS